MMLPNMANGMACNHKYRNFMSFKQFITQHKKLLISLLITILAIAVIVASVFGIRRYKTYKSYRDNYIPNAIEQNHRFGYNTDITTDFAIKVAKEVSRENKVPLKYTLMAVNYFIKRDGFNTSNLKRVTKLAINLAKLIPEDEGSLSVKVTLSTYYLASLIINLQTGMKELCYYFNITINDNINNFEDFLTEVENYLKERNLYK